MAVNATPVRGNDRVPFSCRLCGACCRDVEDKIMLEPLDAYRLGRWLRKHGGVETIEDVYAKFAHPIMLSEGYPIYVLNTHDPDHTCVFLEDGRCRIYDARLKVCRLYPFTVNFGQRGKRFEFYQCQDCHASHFQGSRVRVNDWMYQNFSKEDRDVLDREKTALSELGKAIRALSDAGRKEILFQLLYYRYYNYDLDQPFLPQYDRNHNALMAELHRRLQEA